MEAPFLDDKEEEESRPRSFSTNRVDSIMCFLVCLGFVLLLVILIWFLAVHL
jgi:hypothetical protein